MKKVCLLSINITLDFNGDGAGFFLAEPFSVYETPDFIHSLRSTVGCPRATVNRALHGEYGNTARVLRFLSDDPSRVPRVPTDSFGLPYPTAVAEVVFDTGEIETGKWIPISSDQCITLRQVLESKNLGSEEHRARMFFSSLSEDAIRYNQVA